MAYTPTQISEMEYLVNRGKVVHKKLDEATSEYDRERLKNDLDYIKSELKDAMNAEAMFRAHLRIAQEHLNEAEKLLHRYCK